MCPSNLQNEIVYFMYLWQEACVSHGEKGTDNDLHIAREGSAGEDQIILFRAGIRRSYAFFP